MNLNPILSSVLDDNLAMKTIILFCLLLTSFISFSSLHASTFLETEKSYAQEYKKLRILLEKVQDKNSALLLKSAIEKEIQHLSQNHLSGTERFNTLSTEDKKLFIKKFQKNRFHCGEVTQVMQQRQRILFQPELSEVLRDTLSNIP